MPARRVHLPYRRRGTALAMFAMMLGLLIAFIALAVDVGRLYVVRAELQNAADAAAMAGASVYATDAALRQDLFELTLAINARAQSTANLNRTLGKGTLLDIEDIKLGGYDDRTGTVDYNVAAADRLNVVQVTTRCSEGSPNGPVPYFFAGIFGLQTGNVSASAAALADDRFAGLRVTEASGPTLIPFTIHEDLYEALAVNGPDNFMYDERVYHVVDGIAEVNIYPYKVKATGRGSGKGSKGKGKGKGKASGSDDTSIDAATEDDGAGNFGTLNIGVDNDGLPPIRSQIKSGVTAAQLEYQIGTSELYYYDEAGNPLTHLITGTPGLKGGMESTVESRVGEVVAFFVHRDVVAEGSNAVFTTVGIRFGRLMDVDLSGAPESKRIVVQPVPYMGSSIITHEMAPSTDGQVGRIMLVE